MWNKPTKKMLEKTPKLYSQDGKSEKDKRVHLKFFLGGWTWYVLEIDHNNYDTMFGLVFSPMAQSGEYGYISLKELMDIKTPQGFEVDRDTSISPYKPQPLLKVLRRDGMRT